MAASMVRGRSRSRSGTSRSLTMVYPLMIQLVVVAAVLSPCFVQAKQKPVSVALSGKWGSTPLLLEASEFLAKESNENFWAFVERIVEENPSFFNSANDELSYQIVQKYAAELLSPLQLSLLKFSLALRAFSPAVHMFEQLVKQMELPQSCQLVIEVNGKASCDSSDLSELLVTSDSRSVPPLYAFDHVYPSISAGKLGSSSHTPLVILYARLGSGQFSSIHPSLAKLAEKGEIIYCLRHLVQLAPEPRVSLSGYGVELAIKSTEYKAKDDTKVEDNKESETDEEDFTSEDVEGIVFSTLSDLHPTLRQELKALKNNLTHAATELTPFKVWQIQDLSYQAGQKIMSAPKEDSLQYLRDISQNFPTQARSLVKEVVTQEFKREVQKNQERFQYMGIGPGDSLLYLNGLATDLEIYDIFTLLDIMTSEAKLTEGLHSLGFKGEDLQTFLQMDLSQDNEEKYAVDIRHSAIQYTNDLETEKKYRSWPTSIQDLLRPAFPGMLRHVAKNMFNLVFVVNPTETKSKNLLKMAEAFQVHKAPLRIGITFVVDPDSTGLTDAGVALVRAFTFISQDQNSAAKGLSFITDVYEKTSGSELTAEAVMSEFSLQFPGEDKDLVFGDSDDYDDVRKAGNNFVSQTGLSGLPQVLVNGVPLDSAQFEDAFEEVVVMEVLRQTQVLQRAVYKGEVSDNTDLLDWWMERDNVLPRLNSNILSPPALTLDMTSTTEGSAVKVPAVAAELSTRDLTAGVLDSLVYLTKKEEPSIRSASMLVVCDLETPEGRQLMYTAIKHLKTTNSLRLSVIHNANSLDGAATVSRAVHVALTTLPPRLALSLVTKLVKEENVQALAEGKKTLSDLEVHGMDMEAFTTALHAQSKDFLEVHQLFAARALSLRPGQMAVVTNGAVLGPLEWRVELEIEDFGLMERLAQQRAGDSVAKKLSSMGITGDKGSEMAMKISCLLTSQGKKDKRHEIDYVSDKYSAIKLPADANAPAFTVDAIVDPSSREAQKMAAILMVLRQVANVEMRIFLNPQEKLSEMPVKSFYRYVLEPEVTFDSNGALTSGPEARFTELPQKSLLTLNMDTPESWLVEAVRSPYDLDNILLEEVERSVSADFELEHILIEGHCYDASNMQPPRGLQFVLHTNSSEDDRVDTIVMANLGYFQLKAYPGLWNLELREGRSEDIYVIDSHESTDSPPDSANVVVAVNSFKSKIIRVKVSKKPEKQGESLLVDDGDEQPGLWDSISSSIIGGGNKKEEEKDTTLNIFSVASGHLYERFLRIMMLSVLKNTQSKVKFWFLKNYLSPTFKEFIPHMAEEYGFDYELVQYKWPRWLNQQTEKQRIIWGYKILFLDVLFPLDVKKFIFVDADQIVRADLQELYDLDLGGAPYGYTPFCDSRKEMDGFRFWNSGYWKSHLAGRKYHISALYVVDLKKFRRIAAGDRLRGQYQGLSQDPNSLANLDQDLPNNMIHQVGIKSLPQEWLYCETWCDPSTKPQAKTIDLCNNPLTKEPKLQAALRIVPEWKDYDYEIKGLWDQVYGTDTRAQAEYARPTEQGDSSKTSDKEKHTEL